MTRTLRNISTLVVAVACLVTPGGLAFAQSSDANVSSVELVKEQPTDTRVETTSVRTAPAAVPAPASVAVAQRQPEPDRPVRTTTVRRTPVASARVSSTTPRRSQTPVRTIATAARIQEVEPKPDVQAKAEPVLAQAVPAATSEHVDRIVEFARTKTETANREPAGSPVKMGVSVIVKLAVVLALAYVTILALKLLSTKRENLPRGKQDLRIVDTIKLSPTSSLHVVDFSGKKILVGSSAGQVNLLREFEDGEIREAELATEGRFAEYLSKYSGSAFEKTPAGRVAGMLRDCAAHLRDRGPESGQARGKAIGDTNEA